MSTRGANQRSKNGSRTCDIQRSLERKRIHSRPVIFEVMTKLSYCVNKLISLERAVVFIGG